MTYVDRLREIYDRATPFDVAEGRLWYFAARGELYDVARRYGFSIKRVAFAAAALSNNLAWNQNVALLEHVAHCVKTGIPAKGHYAVLLQKAGRILRDGDLAALSGPKVEPFARALLGDMHACVVDRWMYRAAAESSCQTEARTRNIGVALRMLARDVRRPVAEVQAIIWTTIRRESSAKGEFPNETRTP